MLDKFGIEVEFLVPNADSESYERLFDMVKDALCDNGVKCRDQNETETYDAWVLCEDGSLYGAGSEGIELKSRILGFDENSYKEIATALSTLRSCGAYVNPSCGLHVHINIGNPSLMTRDDIQKVTAIHNKYFDLQEEFDSIMPRSRRNNVYCYPLEHYISPSDLEDALSGDHIWDRSSKVNVLSLIRHGTLEFRQHSGTLNTQKTISWVKFLRVFCQNVVSNVEMQSIFDGQEEDIVNYYNKRRESLLQGG